MAEQMTGGARTPLGIVLPRLSDDYDSEREYKYLEIVLDGGDSFISKKPSKGIPTSNKEFWQRFTDVSASGGGISVETDPTVPAWAKQSQKPEYAYSEITNTPILSDVATSGDYNDLDNKPTIPTLPTLAEVATTGNYSDLNDKPAIPSTPAEVSAYPASFVQYSTTDLTPGVSPLTTGALYLVYE